MSKSTIFVGNLEEGIRYEELGKIFNYFGDIKYIRIIRKKRIAFVTMFDPRDAERAILGLNNTELRDRQIKVEWALAIKNKKEKQVK